MSGLACCWPPSVDGGSGALEIGLTPVVGGIAGELLKVGPGGLLDQFVLPNAPMAIGSPVVGGTSKSVLFVDAASHLAQENASFAYDPAVNTLSVDAVKAVLTRQVDGRFAESFGTGGAAAPHFQASIQSFFVNPDGIPDPELVLGMNTDAGGGLTNPLFGGIGLTMEGYFNNGVTKIQELRLFTVSRAGSGHPAVRVVSISGDQETGAVTLGLSATPGSLKWFDDLGNQQGVLTNGVLVANGPFRSSTYGSVLLEQLNSVGTVHANLFVLGDGFLDGVPDRLSIGVGGAVSRLQLYKGVDVLSFDYTVAPALTLVSTTGVTADRCTIDVDQILPDGVVSRHPGALFCRAGVGQTSSLYVNQSATDPGTVWEQFLSMPPAGPLNLSQTGAGASLQLPKTAIVPVGALVRFKVLDETGAVFYLTGQAA
jgi:hypothetical protein